jgi:hypothetical protein
MIVLKEEGGLYYCPTPTCFAIEVVVIILYILPNTYMGFFFYTQEAKLVLPLSILERG